MSEDQPHRQRLLFRAWYSKGVSHVTHVLEETQWQAVEEEAFIVEMRGSSGCALTEAVGIEQPRWATQKQGILYDWWGVYFTIALISHTSKVMLKILQARLQQYMNGELPDVQAGFRKGRGTRDQIAKIHWIIERARQFQKNIYFCFIDYAKAFHSVDHNKLWKILQEMGIPDHLTCLLRTPYADQEATVRTRHGAIEWFPTGKGVHQGCILSPCLFNLYAEYIM